MFLLSKLLLKIKVNISTCLEKPNHRVSTPMFWGHYRHMLNWSAIPSFPTNDHRMILLPSQSKCSKRRTLWVNSGQTEENLANDRMETKSLLKAAKLPLVALASHCVRFSQADRRKSCSCNDHTQLGESVEISMPKPYVPVILNTTSHCHNNSFSVLVWRYSQGSVWKKSSTL